MDVGIFTATRRGPQIIGGGTVDRRRGPPRARVARQRDVDTRVQLLGSLAYEQRLDGRALPDALAALTDANKDRCVPALPAAAVSRIARLAFSNSPRALLAIDIWIWSGWVARE